MSHQPEGPLSHEVRFRVPLPVIVPVAALVVIAVVAFTMSRILLSVPKEVAVILAVAIGANILIACAYIALRPDNARMSWGELAIVALYPVVIGLVLAQMGFATGHGEEATGGGGGGESAPAEGGGGGAGGVSAANVAFDTNEIALAAGEQETIQFVNDDTVQHNISIYEDDSAQQDIFVGDIIPGGQEITYEFEAPEPGEYYFQCDVHPTMNGTVTVQ